jgi:hypothetical protein
MLVGLLTKSAGAATWYRVLSFVLGAVGLISFGGLILVPAFGSALGGGLGERIALYGFLACEIITGISLLVKRATDTLPAVAAKASA